MTELTDATDAMDQSFGRAMEAVMETSEAALNLAAGAMTENDRVTAEVSMMGAINGALLIIAEELHVANALKMMELGDA